MYSNLPKHILTFREVVLPSYNFEPIPCFELKS